MKKLTKILKIITIVLFSFIVLTIFISTIYNRIGNSLVKVDIEGLGTRLITLTYQSSQIRSFKIALCINNKINLKISVDDDFYGARIRTFKKNNSSRANQIRFFIYPDDNIYIKGFERTNFIEYDVVKGNELSIQYSQLQKELIPLFEKEFEIITKLHQTHELKYSLQLDSIRNYSLPKKKLNFIKGHPDYELSAVLLSEQSYDTIIKYWDILTENVKNNELGISLFNFIDTKNNTRIGLLAPNFSQTTFSGNTFTLDELKGKYVVLDFWGSWCSPCIADFPMMKEYFNKYKSKVEFVGIACNDSKSKWEKAIKKHQLEWTNILEDKNLNNIRQMYAVSVFPTKIIIDKEGKVVKEIIGDTPEFYHIIDSLMINR